MNKYSHVLTRLFSDTPALYKLYFHLIRKRKGLDPSYFSSDTDYYFDAYPRSGSTFLKHLLLQIFPEKKAAHHLHKVAPIKIALRKRLTVIILFREPAECISSNYLKHFSMRGQKPSEPIDIKLVNKLVEDYYYYYKFVLKKNEKINLVHFDDFISTPSSIVYKLSKLLGYDFNLLVIEHKVDELKKTYKGSSTQYGSSKPSKLKEKKKSVIKTALGEAPHFQDCKRIYSQLLKIS